MRLTGLGFITWSVGRAPFETVSEILSLIVKLAGRHDVIAFQEVQNWPTHEVASIPFFQWRHAEGSYAALCWPQCVEHLDRGYWRSDSRVCSMTLGDVAVFGCYLPDSSKGMLEFREAVQSLKEQRKRLLRHFEPNTTSQSNQPEQAGRGRGRGREQAGAGTATM